MADRSVRVRLEAITSGFNRKLAESAVLTRQFSRELESADGRMSNIVQTGLALAPALAPLGAAGIPVVAGLAAQLGFAALGTGALVLGLNGVGDALDALDKYQLEPTADHFKKLHETISALGPAGGEFVLFLDQVEPKLKRLRALAEQGLLPGVEDGLRNVLHLMPQLRELVFGVSSTVGDLIRDAGDNLDDPRWQRFFAFLQTNARPTLTEMGQTAGNFAEAFSNLVVDFDPLERDFSKGLLHMSQQVKDWSDGLDHSKGFQDLVDYVHANGPRALDTLGALGEALIQIVQAAAPVGSVALPIVTDLLHIVGAIADTPVIGSGLVGLAAAIGIYGRSLALLKTIGLRGSEGVLASTFAGSKGRISEATTALKQFTTVQDRSARSAKQLGTGMYLAYGDPRVRAGIKELGKGAALAAGFAVAQSGLADSVGLSNTASLALMGTLAGPWGIAIGGATGFALDLAHANDDVAAAIKRADAAAKGTDFAEQRAAITDLITKNKQYQELVNPLKHPLTGIKQGGSEVAALFGIDPHGDAQKKLEALQKQLGEVRTGALGLYRVVNGVDPNVSLSVSDNSLSEFITKISPALQRAGLDINSLLTDSTGWVAAKVAVHSWVTEMDSAQGRSKAVKDALDGLQSQLVPTADAAKTLSDALDALFGPEMSQAQAVDQWIQSLHDLRDTLKKNKGVIDGNSEAALKNRDALRGSVTALEDKAKADAAAGVSGNKVARELRKGRDAIIEQAVAAGASRAAVARYLDRLGLSAENLAGLLDRAAAKVGKLSDELRKLRDKTVTIKVRQVFDAQAHAVGGIHTYAKGDVANRHMPELAGPGPTRVWREPETQGEAYIPLANDYRRPRAVDIWERTGMALGLQFRRYAFGGGTGLPDAGGTVRFSDHDIDRIAGALAAVRPSHGDVTINGDPTVYRREMQQARRRSASDGYRRMP